MQRRLVLRFEKDEKTVSTTTISNPKLDDVADTISHVIEKTIKTIGVAVVGYVVIDTARQVLVAQATNPPK